MLIDRVLFRYDDFSEIITLDSIEQHRDYILLLEHLFCATPNCRCKMIYIPAGKRAAHFKTWIGGQHQHSRQCPYNNEPDLEGHPKKDRAKVARLNDKHISGIHKWVFNKLEKRQIGLAKCREKYSIEEERLSTSAFANELTTGNMGQKVTAGDQTTVVKTQESLVAFSNNDIGETQATAGYFKSIVFKEELIEMTITDQEKRNSFRLYFDEVFFANAGEGARQMLEALEDALEKQEEVVITCMGEVVKKEGGIGLRVIRVSDLLINGYQIPNLLFEMDSLFNYVN